MVASYPYKSALMEDHEWTRYYRISATEGVTALHARFVAHRYPRHAHEHCVVGLVESGVQSYSYRRSKHITLAGQMFVVNPGESHTGEAAAETGYVYRTLYLQTEFLRRVLDDLGMTTRFPFLRGAIINDRSLALLLARFHKSLSSQASKLEQESFLLDALAVLLLRYADASGVLCPAGRERAAVLKARDYIESHFDNDISLKRLAGLVSLSPYYFARVFEKATGLPPHAYLESVRITKACELLDKGATIGTTAFSVGYADQSHLTKRFKRILAITPGQYSEANKEARIRTIQLSKK